MNEQDIHYMRMALKEARKGLGRTSPNPAVGAVLVREGRRIAAGFHRRAGAPHAEVDALRKAEGRARGATLYVTLEPCNHQGRTPPCTEAILQAGVSRVVVGMRDPNPGVRGGGCRFLAERGVDVLVGVLERECMRLNEPFLKFVRTGRPFVAAKSAMTLDGWTATREKHARWVTGEQSRRRVHRLRDRFDAILVGVGTILADDPSLTTRGRGSDPIRVIVDTRLRTPPDARVVTQESEAHTLLAVGGATDPERVRFMEAKGARVVRCPVRAGKIDLEALLGILGSMDVTSVLVEG
ncbi:MAG: bifunctional diaminohydroxyphosphoribosylaminopyrimidine deaminase/5-amino-6-(5-phosphoribosylamino)uracil reductase RibD, partial [Deltaproteobacteria bacterium]|nr:bifunctional diaminohydroxyphosphoribosylaminopyrimidine deaminase/5-amino-6-(5-phosphoribosylamino)uracil reductase RibD [Deltaproteobacteria bacterium]